MQLIRSPLLFQYSPLYVPATSLLETQADQINVTAIIVAHRIKILDFFIFLLLINQTCNTSHCINYGNIVKFAPRTQFFLPIYTGGSVVVSQIVIYLTIVTDIFEFLPRGYENGAQSRGDWGGV